MDSSNFRIKDLVEISMGLLPTVAQNTGRVSKIGDFDKICCRITETIQGADLVTIDHQRKNVIYNLMVLFSAILSNSNYLNRRFFTFLCRLSYFRNQ